MKSPRLSAKSEVQHLPVIPDAALQFFIDATLIRDLGGELELADKIPCLRCTAKTLHTRTG